MHSVLFVCTANQCRSPMAEGLLRLRVGDDNVDWRIESAGTWALEGTPATPHAITALKERGYDLDGHRSRLVNLQLLQPFALILTMERGHKEALRIEFPEIASRVYLLSEMIGKVFNIDDPVGSPLKEYRATAQEIDQILDQGFTHIERLSRERLSREPLSKDM